MKNQAASSPFLILSQVALLLMAAGCGGGGLVHPADVLDSIVIADVFERSVDGAGVTCCEDEELPFVVGTVTITNRSLTKKGWFEFETGDATLEATPASGEIPVNRSVTIEIKVKQCDWDYAFLDYSWGFLDAEGNRLPRTDGATVTVTNHCQILREATARLQINPLNQAALRDAILFCPIGEVVRHSADVIAAQIPFLRSTNISFQAAYRNGLIADRLMQLYGNTDYPCGMGDHGYTVCPNIGAPLTPGPWLFVFNIVIGDIPLDDPEHHFQFGFVFDSDGNPANNYQAAPPYSNDFYDDTDLWYSVEYDPLGGWQLKVTDATGGTLTEIPSAARATIMGNTILLAVPLDEFAVSDPRYRVTAFAHKGDYGMGVDEYWSGDTEPKVADGLLQITVDLTP